MIGVHDLQKSLDVGLLLSDCEIINGEVVLVRLKCLIYFYDIEQCRASFHHGGFTASIDDRVSNGSEKGRNSQPLEGSSNWGPEESSFGNKTQTNWCENTNNCPCCSWQGDSMEPK